MPQEVQRLSPATERAFKRVRMGDRYFRFLCLVLLGYALGGRGFAYWGVNPLFIGEITLLVGVYIILKTGGLKQTLGIRLLIPLMVFMFWGMCCTIPYLDTYQKDAIRDAVVWGYGTYAFIVATILLNEPTRLQKLVIYYRKFVVAFLLLAPISTTLCAFFQESLPAFPGSGVPIIQLKGGDMCVHIAGCFAYIVGLGGGLNPWFTSLMMPLNLALNVQGRAGMVAFATAVCVSMVLRPFHPRAMRIFFVIGVGLFFFWASDLRIVTGAREISFEFLTKAINSVVKESDDEAMQGSKEWRMRWWTDIVNYTVHGRYFWMGKGFGINLATDDGYQVEEGESLRSPHNGHMTMLARPLARIHQLGGAFYVLRRILGGTDDQRGL
ncbi:MAG TPA: O-antigen ligase family protein [Tepidisphaeraceae bacterium]|nr:O-antigen ligase family protein [Tepidisphaeraceae bacterium]